MESINVLRANGTGFLHLSRRLQPGERLPVMPSMADQLLSCHLVREEGESYGTDRDDDDVDEGY